jgi:uncharacterized FAD-dependent dehydrogenase
LYDVTIIGAGVAGVFLAYELADSGYNVLLLDKGKRLADRNPSVVHSIDKHEDDSSDTYIGFGGLGRSEGKFNYSHAFGGALEAKVGTTRFQELMSQVDDVICTFGGDQATAYSTHHPELAKRAEAAGLKMISTIVRHLGTKLSMEVFQRLYEYLLPRIDMYFEQDIQSILPKNEKFLIHANRKRILTKRVVIATGRSGVNWVRNIGNSFGLIPTQTRLDLGIRVEMKASYFQSVLQNTFETKLMYQQGNDTATTYCMNPQGRIIRKYQEGLVMPDGQNYREQADGGTTNLNFTLFCPRYFKSLQDANNYAHSVIGKINRGTDRIVVQRWEDFIHRRETKPKRMLNNTVQPTLRADEGNLYREVPVFYLEMLQGFMHRLQRLIGESIDEDTLLYGIDAKFYAPIIETNSYLETKIPNLFLIGDCSGVTHSLSQAAASGLYVGAHLKHSWQKKALLI